MSLFQQYLYVIGSFQGLLLTFLLVFSSQTTNASRILGVWCLLLALSFMAAFITMEGELNRFTFLYGWSFFFPASYGALLYLYCRHAIADRPFKLADLLHFLPIVICCLLNLDILFASPQAKLDIALTHPQHPVNLILAEGILFLQAFVYIGASIMLIKKYQNAASHRLSNYNPDIFSWLWKLLILDLVIWLFKAAGVIFGNQYAFFILGDILIIVLIYSIAMAQWRNPKLFQIEQFNCNLANVRQTELTTNEVKNININENTGALTGEIRSQLLMVVRRHMDENQTYLDNELTLSKLANLVGVSTHHLSEVLNQQDGKNFYQFVNEYRIKHVCEQLSANPAVKILDLALESGFSSKSTFNAVFKQLTHQTPSQFREQLSAN